MRTGVEKGRSVDVFLKKYNRKKTIIRITGISIVVLKQ